MQHLKPSNAAYAADAIYKIRTNNEADDGIRGLNNTFKDKFVFGSGGTFKGKSGGHIIQSSSGFGAIARGVGAYENQALIAIRGTHVGMFNWFDVITDLNIGMRMSSSGNMIHAGFDKTFKSFKDQIRENFTGYNPSQVHIVGHSLGGALATLTADWMSASKISNPSVYTFGSPRVGSESFARNFTHRVGEENIHRVYHKSDPISMIPLWPFMHVPLPGSDYFIDDREMVPYGKMHAMDKYSMSVKSAVNWSSLTDARVKVKNDSKIEKWLESDSVVATVAGPFFMIGEAILYILKKVMKGVAITLQAGLSTALTALDIVAMAFHKAAKGAKEAAGLIKRLMMKILKVLGFAVTVTSNLTLDFIKWVLTSLTRSIYNGARQALYMLPKV